MLEKTTAKYMQHSDKHTYNVQINTLTNICLKKQMKNLEHLLATYVYNQYNICNIPI
jgi:uncharacterized Zn-finger protein